jgi:hypothetical protein
MPARDLLMRQYTSSVDDNDSGPWARAVPKRSEAGQRLCVYPRPDLFNDRRVFLVDRASMARLVFGSPRGGDTS